MDTNRIFRFTVAGWALLTAYAIQLWVLGFDLPLLYRPPAGAQSFLGAIGSVIVGAAASPFLGFLVSSVAEPILRWCRGGDAQFDVAGPIAVQELVADIRVLLPEWESELASIGDKLGCLDWSKRRQAREQCDELMRYVNVAYHTHAPAALIEYTTRRWTLYWMYANSLCAFVLASAAAALTAWPFWTRTIDLRRVLLEIGLALFIVFAAVPRLGTLSADVSATVKIWLRHESKRVGPIPAS